MSYMFYKCSSLDNLDISNFGMNNIMNMSYMFFFCSSLNNLSLPKKINKNANMTKMFYGCSPKLLQKVKNLYINNSFD